MGDPRKKHASESRVVQVKGDVIDLRGRLKAFLLQAIDPSRWWKEIPNISPFFVEKCTQKSLLQRLEIQEHNVAFAGRNARIALLWSISHIEIQAA